MIDVKAKKNIATAINVLPQLPTADDNANCVNSMPLILSTPLSNTPDDKIMMAVALQITIVSIKTPSI